LQSSVDSHCSAVAPGSGQVGGSAQLVTIWLLLNDAQQIWFSVHVNVPQSMPLAAPSSPLASSPAVPVSAAPSIVPPLVDPPSTGAPLLLDVLPLLDVLLLVEAPLLLVEAPLLLVEAPLLLVEAPLLLVEAPLLLVEAPLLDVPDVPPLDDPLLDAPLPVEPLLDPVPLPDAPPPSPPDSVLVLPLQAAAAITTAARAPKDVLFIASSTSPPVGGSLGAWLAVRRHLHTP
jgi:hypothetical protein